MFAALHFLPLSQFLLPLPPVPCLLLLGAARGDHSSTSTAELVPWAGFCPNSCLGDTIPILITQESVSCCSPDASLCVLHRWERGQEDKNNCSVLFGKGCHQRSGKSELLPLSKSGLGWRYCTLKAQSKFSVENLAPHAF